jgi:hypothetical protein
MRLADRRSGLLVAGRLADLYGCKHLGLSIIYIFSIISGVLLVS